MKFLYIFILTILSISAHAQEVATKDSEPYDYPASLTGGYTISFEVDSVLQHLFLKKGSKTIIELASVERGMLQKNLGYIGADFKDCFVLVHSFGSGNPHYIELIRKATGENFLEKGAVWIDADEKKKFLLYSANDVPARDDKMTLYNSGTGKKEFFNFPEDIFDGPQILNRIEIAMLSARKLVIEYNTEKGSKTKLYRR